MAVSGGSQLYIMIYCQETYYACIYFTGRACVALKVLPGFFLKPPRNELLTGMKVLLQAECIKI